MKTQIWFNSLSICIHPINWMIYLCTLDSFYKSLLGMNSQKYVILPCRSTLILKWQLWLFSKVLMNVNEGRGICLILPHSHHSLHYKPITGRGCVMWSKMRIWMIYNVQNVFMYFMMIIMIMIKYIHMSTQYWITGCLFLSLQIDQCNLMIYVVNLIKIIIMYKFLST